MQVDLLVSCAGVLEYDELDTLDFNAMRHQYEVNALGPLRLVKALRQNLQRGSKVAVLTSKMASFAESRKGGAVSCARSPYRAICCFTLSRLGMC